MISPYTRDFQIQLLINLLRDKKFFEETVGRLHLSDFDLPPCRLIFEIARTYFLKHRELPPFRVIELELIQTLQYPSLEYETVLQEAEHESLAGIMSMFARSAPSDLAVPYYREKLHGFMSHMRLAAAKGLGLTAEQELAESVRIHSEVSKVGRNRVILVNATSRPPDMSAVLGGRIGIGLNKVDKLINYGLTSGQTGMVVACTGIGKTNTGLNMCVAAALKNTRSLFMTLENTVDMIHNRIFGMFAHIEAQHLIQRSLLDKNSAWRLDFVSGDAFRYHNYITIADCTQRPHGVDDIKDIISVWLEDQIERLGHKEEECRLINVDWIEKIVDAGIVGIHKNMSTADRIKHRMEALAEINRSFKKILWTSTQGTRAAQNHEIIVRGDIANSIHVMDPLDLCIGLAPSVIATDTRDDDDVTNPVCDRRLNVSLLKTRESAATGRHRQVYQGKTLRLWDDESQFTAATQLADQCNMDGLLKLMAPQSVTPGK
jgi:hypothetical protein